MPLEGMQLGRYRLLRLLGSGAMGEVYLAEDVRIQQQVAIKVLRTEAPSETGDDTVKEAVYLFQREAMTIAKLDHPNILSLYDYGEVDSDGLRLTYLVMPFRPEGSLAKWLVQRGKSTQLSPQDAAHFISQAASALQHAHDHDVVHQDVKPSNFLIRRNGKELPDILLADFGVAKFMSAATSDDEAIRGTPAYMAPEQWSGYAVPATDQYALAVMACLLLTGRLPFLGTQQQMMYLHFRLQPHAPSKFNPNVPPDLDEVILRALAKRPEDRFPSIAAFGQAFEQAVQNMDAATFMNTPDTARSEEITAMLAISEVEARQGTNRMLTLPGGQRVSVSIPAGIRSGQVIYLEGQQQPDGVGDGFGRLLLTINITKPEEVAPVLPADIDEMTVQGGFPSEAARPATVRPRRRFSRLQAILLAALAVLVLIISVELFFLNRLNLSGSNNNVGNSTPTSTLTAAANPYTHSGRLELNDPLSVKSGGTSWQEDSGGDGGICRFTGGAYRVTEPQKGTIHTCFAQSTDFTNFAYEAQMTIFSGDYGGILFRANKTHSQFYAFRIDSDGHFYLSRYIDGNPAHAQVLAQGRTRLYVHTDTNQINVLAVVVRNDTIVLYVNQKKLETVHDSSYTSGQIGVFAGSAGGSTDVVFSDVKVWAF